jgi:transcriptional regulator with XRE-family HTH domain
MPGYAPVAPDETRALSLRADILRTNVDTLGSDVHDRHGEVREQDLVDRTRDKASKSVANLLLELTTDRGMGWSDIAEVVGVSVSAIRKWRQGGEASPGSRMKLARIAAFLDLLERKAPIDDPASWMELDLPLAPGFYIRPLDLYVDGHEDAILDLAEGRQGAETVLDRVRPNWRDGRSDFEVFADIDGQRSIRRRER